MKLIEVALPLAAIGREAARERFARTGSPTTLHPWRGRRPLAVCRSLLFAALVDDPESSGAGSDYLALVDSLPAPEPLPADWEALPLARQRRERLLAFVGKLTRHESAGDEAILALAYRLIKASRDGVTLPTILDPFSGAGSIPLESARLGLTVRASDLNPVAALITQATVGHQSPGLAEEIRRSGRWIEEKAERRLRPLYPKLCLPGTDGGSETEVEAWIWARTVRCPNPACGAELPLVKSFALSTRRGAEAWIEPLFDRRSRELRFDVRTGQGAPPGPTVGVGGATCLACGTIAPFEYVRSQAQGGRIGFRLMAIAARKGNERVFSPATPEQESAAASARPLGVPDADLSDQTGHLRVTNYGLRRYADLFTSRQQALLTTLCDLVGEARERLLQDSADKGPAYADAVATYLALAVSKLAASANALARWRADQASLTAPFSLAKLAMAWEFAESNPFFASGLSFGRIVSDSADLVELLPTSQKALVEARDAVSADWSARSALVCTDPPVAGDPSSAVLSDFHYVWLRRALGGSRPDLFGTLLSPKTEELSIPPPRFGGSDPAVREHFEERLAEALRRLALAQHPDYPLVILQEISAESGASEQPQKKKGAALPDDALGRLVETLASAGLGVSAIWPIRVEPPAGLPESDRGSFLAAIVCRPLAGGTGISTRRDFSRAARREIDSARPRLRRLAESPAQWELAAIGVGLRALRKFERVLEADGQTLPALTALGIVREIVREAKAIDFPENSDQPAETEIHEGQR